MASREINDRLATGVPCCGLCGEWLRGTENYCPHCGAEQTAEGDDGGPVDAGARWTTRGAPVANYDDAKVDLVRESNRRE